MPPAGDRQRQCVDEIANAFFHNSDRVTQMIGRGGFSRYVWTKIDNLPTKPALPNVQTLALGEIEMRRVIYFFGEIFPLVELVFVPTIDLLPE